jgi:hypothetical protein
MFYFKFHLSVLDFESKLRMMGFDVNSQGNSAAVDLKTATNSAASSSTADHGKVLQKSTVSTTPAAPKTNSILAIATSKAGADLSTPSISKPGGSSLYSLIKKQSVNTPSAVESSVPKTVTRGALPDEDAGHDSFDSDDDEHDEIHSRDACGTGVVRQATVKFASSVDEFVAPDCSQSVNSSSRPSR